MKKLKHDHKGTKILKLGIFASLMLAPLLAISFKCAYVTFNKNAKDSYYGETINEKQVNYLHSNDLQNGMNVNIINGTYTAPSGLSVTNNQIWVDNVINLGNTNDYSQVKILGFYYPSSNLSLYMYDSEGTTLYSDVRTYNISFTFQGFKKDDGQRLHTIIDDNNYIFDYIYNKNSYLDNAFYYAIDEAMDSQYFAWARTSALYTPTSTMTQGMGINTNAIPTLLVYWLILTAVYVIVDIVIELFTYLTHMITSRLEE